MLLNNKKSRLEPVYLMSIVPCLGSLSTLLLFHQVSKKCDEAISRIKINPSFRESDVETLFQKLRPKNVAKEMTVFTGLETLHIDINSLDQIDPQNLEKYQLIHIPFINRKSAFLKSKNFQQFKCLVSSFGIDLFGPEPFDTSDMLSLREVKFRINKNIPKDIIETFVNGLKGIPHLRKVVISCDSQLIEMMWDLVKEFNFKKTEFIFKLNWLRDEDCNLISTISNHVAVGLLTNGFGKFNNVFIKSGVVLLFYTDCFLQLSSQITVDPHFQQLLTMYNPYKIEIQSNTVQALTTQGTVISFKSLKSLKDLFLNDLKYTEPVSFELPECLENLEINNFTFLDKHGLIGLRETKVPKEQQARYVAFI
ncbi:hypothetical protein EIN_400000 [Entamoeba invadens IP1]|uniref:Uncharacterized protein n=1 Tax=Entamoeba invadens IP1 TaxID=370355 RepID=A0A0A1UAD0_ENTIV|nr:hypothetical protein EIN_400000 [Entamoeba invadens IP1]ELP91940.1 hypothetical protein EIN_400000 [Entamoeba invadens IP1]|eukprot:XP_004258711.1 hypothetical protein EIN_400000 [Entamoeba invadens IP1]